MFLGEFLGQIFNILTSKRYGFSSLLVPFPRDPLRFILFVRKTRIVSPFACPCHYLPMNPRLGMIAGRFRCSDVIFMTMIMFVYLKLYEMQSCNRKFVQVCFCANMSV